MSTPGVLSSHGHDDLRLYPNEGPRTDDCGMERFLALLDELDEAVNRLQPELDNMRKIVEHTRQHLAAGEGFKKLYETSNAPSARDILIERLSDLHSALMRSRAEYIRLLVDEEGMTIPAVARLVGHPPQLVRRLYQAAHRGQTAVG